MTECDCGRHTEWIQWNNIRVWSDLEWEDTHNGGMYVVSLGRLVTITL